MEAVGASGAAVLRRWRQKVLAVGGKRPGFACPPGKGPAGLTAWKTAPRGRETGFQEAGVAHPGARLQ